MNDYLKALGGVLICIWLALLAINIIKPSEIDGKLFVLDSILIILLMLYERSKE